MESVLAWGWGRDRVRVRARVSARVRARIRDRVRVRVRARVSEYCHADHSGRVDSQLSTMLARVRLGVILASCSECAAAG